MLSERINSRVKRAVLGAAVSGTAVLGLTSAGCDETAPAVQQAVGTALGIDARAVFTAESVVQVKGGTAQAELTAKKATKKTARDGLSWGS